jgi:hypothetical protein
VKIEELKKVGAKLKHWTGTVPSRKKRVRSRLINHVNIPLPKWLGFKEAVAVARVHPAEFIRVFQAACVWFLSQAPDRSEADRMRGDKELRGVMAGLRNWGKND